MNLNIGQKIIAIFGVFLFLIAIFGAYQLRQLEKLEEHNNTIVFRDVKILDQLQHMMNAQENLRFLGAQALIRHLAINQKIPSIDPEMLSSSYKKQLKELNDLIHIMQTDIESYVNTEQSSERRDGFRKMVKNLQHSQEDTKQIEQKSAVLFNVMDDSEVTADIEEYSKITTLYAEITEHMEYLWELSDGVISSGHRESAAAYTSVYQFYLWAFSSLFIVGTILSLLLRGTIVHPLNDFMKFVERIGQGNLTGRITIEQHDEIGELGAHLNQMVDGLRNVAVQTRAVTENLNSATVQIRASTQEQAASVEEQLAAVQQTSATLDEITQSGVQISRRAKDVVIAAEATLTSSQIGLRAVKDTAQAMDAIRDQAESVAENIVMLSEKTQAIGEIIISVNEIAERSHLLALNAAIEAVAAGEHGRRFSVVASEIKNLADQAKEATSQVRTILGDIQRGINASVMLTEEAVKRIAFGKEHTDATQGNIQKMSNNILESVQTFQQIVAATNQHQIGLEQIMVALQNIRQASKQTADTTRQLDGAAANLNALSQQLTQAISGYQL